MVNGRPPQKKAITPEQTEALKKLGGIFNRQAPYTPVTKSLDAIGMPARIMDIMLGDTPTECLVIPVQELMYREWKHMTGGIMQPVDIAEQEREANDGN